MMINKREKKRRKWNTIILKNKWWKWGRGKEMWRYENVRKSECFSLMQEENIANCVNRGENMVLKTFSSLNKRWIFPFRKQPAMEVLYLWVFCRFDPNCLSWSASIKGRTNYFKDAKSHHDKKICKSVKWGWEKMMWIIEEKKWKTVETGMEAVKEEEKEKNPIKVVSNNIIRN